VPAPPVFRRLQQSSSDALIPIGAPHRDLRNLAKTYFSVHRIQRLIESGIQKSDNLTTEFRYKGDILSALV
jgi:hypothetical protein